MASISFPHSAPGHLPHSSLPHDHEPGFYRDTFDTHSNSSFQMNPMSSHPPRTPRTSTAYSNYDHSDAATSVRDETARPNLTVDVPDDVDEDEDDYKSQKARVSKEEIWRELLKSSMGRDKTFKLIQYSLKVYLLFHGSLKRTYTSRKWNFTITWEDALVRRLSSTVSGLSLTRKCLLLFNWLSPLTVILAQQSVPYSTESATPSSLKRKARPLLYTFLHAPPPVLLELVHAVADDVYTFSRLGLFSQRLGDRAGKFSDWCWFASTLVNLVENAVERGVMKDLQTEVEGRSYSESMTGATSKSNPVASKIDDDELKRLHKQDYWLRMTRNKLFMDLIFVSYDCFRIQRAKAPVQAFTGLAAAVLSASKLYSREQTLLAKSIKS